MAKQRVFKQRVRPQSEINFVAAENAARIEFQAAVDAIKHLRVDDEVSAEMSEYDILLEEINAAHYAKMRAINAQYKAEFEAEQAAAAS